MKNALVMLHPLSSFVEGFLILRRERFVVDGRICNGAGDRVDHGFEETANSFNLTQAFEASGSTPTLHTGSHR